MGAGFSADSAQAEKVSSMTNAELDALAIENDSRRGQVALRNVHRFLGRFIAYPSEHAHAAHALWIAHTHLMEAWESTPRLAFLSPEPASGKTRALEISELLVPSPVEAVNVTPAYLFRKVGSDDGRPTILYDEIDTVFGPKAKDNEEIRGLLNAGHRRGAVVGRCVTRGKTIETEEIPAYSAVALAGLGWLPDTLLSRSIIIRMRRRKPGEKVEAFRRRVNAAEGDRLKGELAVWASGIDVSSAWPEMPAGVEDRDADVWEPLLAVADAAGGEWPKLAREAAVTLVAAAREVEPSLGIRLLADARTVFGDSESITTAALLEALHALPESPWKDIKGKPLNDRGLAVRLRQYGVKSKTIRIGHGPKDTAKGYSRADFAEAWEVYLSPLSSATSVTSVTGPDFQGFGVTDVTDDVTNVTASNGARKAHKIGTVTAVTDVTLLAGSRRPPDDYPDMPGFLRRPQPEPVVRCSHCGQPATPADPLNPYEHDGREVRLHTRCEAPWFDTARVGTESAIGSGR
jgi:hypothetical protein